MVGSLAYLAIQIRSQNSESRAAAAHDISVGFRDNVAAFADPEIADIFLRANEDLDALTDVEKFRLITSGQRVLRLYEEAFNMHKRGRLENDVWVPMTRQCASIMAAPGIRYVWESRRAYYNDEFRQYVEELPDAEFHLGELR